MRLAVGGSRPPDLPQITTAGRELPAPSYLISFLSLCFHSLSSHALSFGFFSPFKDLFFLRMRRVYSCLSDLRFLSSLGVFFFLFVIQIWLNPWKQMLLCKLAEPQGDCGEAQQLCFRCGDRPKLGLGGLLVRQRKLAELQLTQPLGRLCCPGNTAVDRSSHSCAQETKTCFVQCTGWQWWEGG